MFPLAAAPAQDRHPLVHREIPIAATRVLPTAQPLTGPSSQASRTVSRLLTVGMVLAAVGFVAVTLGTSLIGRTAFYGGGLLLNNVPWIADVDQPVMVDNPLVGDTIDVVLPSRHQIVERVRSGDLAGWSSLQGPGTELGSVPSYGLLAPTAAAWWLLPADLAPGWERLTILVVAAAGTALFLRRIGLGHHAAWTAGMVYAASGFMVAWTNWPQAAVAAMMPWLLWAVERSLQRRTLGSVVPVALTVAALLLGGFPALTGWAVYLAGAYALLRLVVELRRGEPGRWRTAAAQVGRLSLGLVLGIGLAAAQLAVFVLQFLELDTSYRAGGFTATQPLRMGLTALFPHTWGTNVNVFFTRTNPIEANAYLGTAAALLCVLALTARPHPAVLRGVRTFFAAAAALCALLVYVQGPLVAWMGALPIFSGNPVGRLVALLLLALSVLTGYGADAILRSQRERESRVRRGVVAASAVATGGVVLVLAGYVRSQVNGQRGADPRLASMTTVTPFLATAVAIAGVVVIVILLRQWRPRAAVAAFVVVPVAVSVQGVMAAAPVWEQVDADRFYPATDMHDFLLEHLGSDRMATTGLTMLNGTPAYYGLRSATGHVFFPEAYSDLIDRIDPDGRYTPTYWTLRGGLDLDIWRSPGLDRLAVRYLATGSDTAIPGVEMPLVTGTSPGELAPEPVEVALPDGPLRGVNLQLLDGPADPSSGYVVAEVLDPSGATVAATERHVRFPRPPGPLPVPLAAETLDGPATLRLSWTGSPSPSFAVDASGVPALGLVLPDDDDLRLAADDDGAVWERTTSLPRIRWARSALVVADAERRAHLVADVDLPSRTVVLSEPGKGTDGQGATVGVREDSGDTVDVAVDADGAGYLVLAEAIQDDWTVTVDGRTATIEDADHAFGAVHVPAGRHEVVFTYTPRGQAAGFAVSALSAAALLGMAATSLAGRRRNRSTGGAP